MAIPNNNVSAQLAHNPLAQYLAANLPTPQNPGPYIRFIRPDGMWNNQGDNAYVIGAIQNTDNRYSIRMDHAFSDHDRLFARWSDTPLTSSREFGFAVTSPLDAYPSDVSFAKNVALNEVHIFAANMVNEVRLLFMRNLQNRAESGPAVTKDWAASLGLTPSVAGAGFPGLSFGYMFPESPAFPRPPPTSLPTWIKTFKLPTTFHGLSAGTPFEWVSTSGACNPTSCFYNGIYGGQYTFAASSTNNGSSGGDGLASLMLGLDFFVQQHTGDGPVLLSLALLWRLFSGRDQAAVESDVQPRACATKSRRPGWRSTTTRGASFPV